MKKVFASMPFGTPREQTHLLHRYLWITPTEYKLCRTTAAAALAVGLVIGVILGLELAPLLNG